MRLGSGTYKEIALDALKGNWVKAAVAGLFANWLGVFSSSFLFIAKYAFIAVILIYFLEFLPGFYSILSFYSKKTPASKVGDELRLYLLDRAS